jgi:hypothetical protein
MASMKAVEENSKSYEETEERVFRRYGGGRNCLDFTVGGFLTTEEIDDFFSGPQEESHL